MFIFISDNNNEKTETMTNFNNTLTIQEATELFKSKSGMHFPNTDHNRKMMKQVIDAHLKSLRA